MMTRKISENPDKYRKIICQGEKRDNSHDRVEVVYTNFRQTGKDKGKGPHIIYVMAPLEPFFQYYHINKIAS
jgi:hypothetical protein